MPEAFSSIADLRIVIDATTDKLDVGLTAAKNLVARFAEEGSQSTSLFDRALGKTAASAEGIAGKLSGVLGKLNRFKAFYDAAVATATTVGDLAAEQTGTVDQWEETKKSAADLQASLVGGLGLAFDSVKDSALGTASSLLGFDSNATGAGATAHDVAEGGFTELKNVLDDLKFRFESKWIAPQHQSMETLEAEVTRAKDALAELEDQMAALSTMNADMPGTVNQSSLDALQQEIEAMKLNIFLWGEYAGMMRVAAAAKDDTAIKNTDAFKALQAQTEAMELNVATMRMSTEESALYRAEAKTRAALDDAIAAGDDKLAEALERQITANHDRYMKAVDDIKTYNDEKKNDGDAKQYLDRLNQETDGLRDRVAVLGMATVAAAAYTAQARNQRSIDALGDLDPETLKKVNAALEEQSRLNLQLMADADQRRVQQAAASQDRTASNAVNALERDVANEQLRASAIGQSTAATAAQAAAERALLAIRQSGREATPDEIKHITELTAARQAATEAAIESQERTKLVNDVGGVFSNDVDAQLRKWVTGAELTKQSFADMARSIIADLEQIALKAAIVTPLSNLLTGGASGGGGLIGQLLGGLGGSAAPTLTGWATSLIPAFAEGGDFPGGGPVMVGERGPELMFPRSPGTVVPNNALPGLAAAQPTRVQVEISLDNDMLRATVRDESGQQIAQAAPAIVNASVAQSSSRVMPTVSAARRYGGGDYRG